MQELAHLSGFREWEREGGQGPGNAGNKCLQPYQLNRWPWRSLRLSRFLICCMCFGLQRKFAVTWLGCRIHRRKQLKIESLTNACMFLPPLLTAMMDRDDLHGAIPLRQSGASTQKQSGQQRGEWGRQPHRDGETEQRQHHQRPTPVQRRPGMTTRQTGGTMFNTHIDQGMVARAMDAAAGGDGERQRRGRQTV